MLSLSWTSPWAQNGLPPVDDFCVESFVRGVDWDMGIWRRSRLALRDAFRAFATSRGCDAVIVTTTGIDAVLLAMLLRLRRGQRLALYDLLLPRSRKARRLARWALKRVDVWIVIRRGDAGTFERELGASQCHFVPFPAYAPMTEAVAEEPFVYAAGSAHRDWLTLVNAASRYGVKTLISTNDSVFAETGGPVTVVPLKSPSEGLATMGRAAIVCVPLRDTELPSGPLVVLDALSAGKALVASDVNGTRDYVGPYTGVLVPPGDADALGSVLRALMDDHERRRELSQRARSSVSEFQPAGILNTICRVATFTDAL